VRESRKFLLGELRKGIAQGTVRDDVGAEELLVIVTGTIHTLAGTAGVHGGARRPRPPSARKALDALRKILTPSARPRRAPARRRAGSRAT